ncbi:AraC family transcriptional regulator [Paenibacillus antri]|uniref:AraC family transcriptional regulator n=1 Tax=Paenibacillus antri TaxID=2582848 RepID=A0A5R9GB32_9BACL|nr:AraC family transcriptional regulator [Paenibacillus antri]TLS51300.1 AraC family transcriptional regulator [Paenibacillus antri]
MQGVEVLSASFSYHTKPFHVVAKEGLQTHYLLRLQTEGRCRTRIDGALVPVEPGDLMLYAPDMPYELHVEEEERGNGRAVASGDYFVFFRGAWADEWWKQKPRPVKMRVSLDEALVPLWRQMIAEHRRQSEQSAMLLDYLMRVVCLTVDRLCSEQRPMKGNAFLAYRMKNYIEERATTLFQLKDLARHCNVSVSRAVHLYKQFFGKSIIQYAQEVRLKVALERMLYTQTPLEVIAETSGFPSYTYFYRVFKKEFGVSPQQYRSERSGALET